jgi:hypothetical protein
VDDLDPLDKASIAVLADHAFHVSVDESFCFHEFDESIEMDEAGVLGDVENAAEEELSVLDPAYLLVEDDDRLDPVCCLTGPDYFEEAVLSPDDPTGLQSIDGSGRARLIGKSFHDGGVTFLPLLIHQEAQHARNGRRVEQKINASHWLTWLLG